jgi:cell division protein FtsA
VRPGNVVTVEPTNDFVGKAIQCGLLDKIIQMRMREIFEVLKRRIEPGWLRSEILGAGVQLTGGSSFLRGIGDVGEEVFGLPVSLASAKEISLAEGILDNPGYACAIGLVKVAHEQEMSA